MIELMLIHTQGAADVAFNIARDLRTTTRPSISRAQIRSRLVDYFDDPATEPTDDQLDRMVSEIALHPSIRLAVRD